MHAKNKSYTKYRRVFWSGSCYYYRCFFSGCRNGNDDWVCDEQLLCMLPGRLKRYPTSSDVPGQVNEDSRGIFEAIETPGRALPAKGGARRKFKTLGYIHYVPVMNLYILCILRGFSEQQTTNQARPEIYTRVRLNIFRTGVQMECFSHRK